MNLLARVILLQEGGTGPRHLVGNVDDAHGVGRQNPEHATGGTSGKGPAHAQGRQGAFQPPQVQNLEAQFTIHGQSFTY